MVGKTSRELGGYEVAPVDSLCEIRKEARLRREIQVAVRDFQSSNLLEGIMPIVAQCVLSSMPSYAL